MAEGGKPQFDLGQLFIDIREKGLGRLQKGLSGLGQTFKDTVKSSVPFVKGIVNMSQNAASAITGWDKLNATMGMSLQDIQKISRFTGLNNIDFNSYMGQLKNVQQKLLDIRTGMSNDVQGFALLGLNPRDFDPNEPLKLLDTVKKRVQSVDTVTAAAALRWMGLSEDLLYVWKQQNNNFDSRLNLSDKEIENLKKQRSLWNSLGVTWEAAQQKFMANQTEINHLMKMFTEWTAGDHPFFSNLFKSLDWFFSTDWDEKIKQWNEWRGDHKEMQKNLKKDIIKTPEGMSKDNALEWKKAAKQRADSIIRQEQVKNVIKKPNDMSDKEFNKLINKGDLQFQQTLIGAFDSYQDFSKREQRKRLLGNHASEKLLNMPYVHIKNPYLLANPKVEQVNNIYVTGNNAAEIADMIPDKIIDAAEKNGQVLQNPSNL